MNKIKRIRLFALVALVGILAPGAYAQLGVEAGYDFLHGKGTLAAGEEGHFSGATRNHGFRVGLTYDFTIKGNLGLHTGVLYSYAAGNVWETDRSLQSFSVYGTMQVRSVYQQLEVPIRVRYDLPVTNDFKFFVFGGPVLGYTLSGQVKDWSFRSSSVSLQGTTTYPRTCPYNVYERYGLMPFELKLGAGLGVHYKHYVLKFSYDWGLLDQYTRGTASDKVHHNQLNVSVGYVF